MPMAISSPRRRMGRGGSWRRAKNPHRHRAKGAAGEAPASATACCCMSRRRGGRRHPPSRPLIKIIDRPKQRVLGIFRKAPMAAEGWSRSTRKCSQGARHSGRRHRRRAGRRPGRGRDRPRPAPRPAERARGGEARLARQRARGQSHRHPRAFDPACFRRETLLEATAPSRRRCMVVKTGGACRS